MITQASLAIGLVADIGGTNVRFALCYPGHKSYCKERTLPCSQFSSLMEAAETYLATVCQEIKPTIGAFAVASPVTGDAVMMTNHNWQFSIESVRLSLHLDRLSVMNDFTAVALCIPHLTSEQFFQVGEGTPVAGAPIGVLGAGTGLGIAFLIPLLETGSTTSDFMRESYRWHCVPTEGGHTTMAAADDRESTVLSVLRRYYGHVSAERVLSGSGLVNLYSALEEISSKMTNTPITPSTITALGISGTNALCVETIQMFLAMLGTVASDLALNIGGRGGIYIAGGIIHYLTTIIQKSSFRKRFEDKGRFRDYVSRIPTYVITHPYPALLGLSSLLHTSSL